MMTSLGLKTERRQMVGHARDYLNSYRKMLDDREHADIPSAARIHYLRVAGSTIDYLLALENAPDESATTREP